MTTYKGLKAFDAPPTITEINEKISEIKSLNKEPTVSPGCQLLSCTEIKELVLHFYKQAADRCLEDVLAYLKTELPSADYQSWESKILSVFSPQPPTLNSIALRFLKTIEKDGRYLPEITDTIRMALEAKVNNGSHND